MKRAFRIGHGVVKCSKRKLDKAIEQGKAEMSVRASVFYKDIEVEVISVERIRFRKYFIAMKVTGTMLCEPSVYDNTFSEIVGELQE